LPWWESWPACCWRAEGFPDYPAYCRHDRLWGYYRRRLVAVSPQHCSYQFQTVGTVFFEPKGDPQELVKEIVGFAHKARKEGIVSLDRELENVKEPFLRKSLMLAVDGTEPQNFER